MRTGRKPPADDSSRIPPTGSGPTRSRKSVPRPAAARSYDRSGINPGTSRETNAEQSHLNSQSRRSLRRRGPACPFPSGRGGDSAAGARWKVDPVRLSVRWEQGYGLCTNGCLWPNAPTSGLPITAWNALGAQASRCPRTCPSLCRSTGSSFCHGNPCAPNTPPHGTAPGPAT